MLVIKNKQQLILLDILMSTYKELSSFSARYNWFKLEFIWFIWSDNNFYISFQTYDSINWLYLDINTPSCSFLDYFTLAVLY